MGFFMKIKFLLPILLLCSFFAHLVQTNWGQTSITLKRLDTENNQYLYYDLYKPANATSTSKAPLIAVIPGFQRSKEALSNVAIELSRRGHVVALIDPYAQGLSSSSSSTLAATTQGYGMFHLVDHYYDNDTVDYIDKNLIAATGHSMGGNAAVRGGDLFGQRSQRNNEKSRLHSIFISGYVLTLRDEILKNVRSNIGVSYALYDEGAFRNELSNWDAANMEIAPESLRVVNSIYDQNEQISKVELGRYYGESEDRSIRVVFNEKLLHPFQPYNREAMANQLSYFDNVLGSPIALDPNNQTWQWKEFFTLINLIISFLLIIPITKALLNLNFFSGLKKTVPDKLPKQTLEGKKIFWFTFLLSATIACVTFIPLVDTAKILFPEASSRQLTWFFPQRMNNSVMLWAVLNGVVGLIIFFVSYQFFGKKHNVEMSSWGVDIEFSELLKTFVLGIIIFLIYFSILYSIYYVFHIDYRFWFIGVRIFQPEMLLVLLMFFPFFLIFFMSNSLRVNGAMRFEGQPEVYSRLVAGLANSFGLILIIMIQYVTYFMTGEVYWTTNWLSVNLLFGIVPIMFVLPIFNRIFFQMTGRIYLGPIVTCLIFIMILSTNTVVYLPL